MNHYSTELINKLIYNYEHQVPHTAEIDNHQLISKKSYRPLTFIPELAYKLKAIFSGNLPTYRFGV